MAILIPFVCYGGLSHIKETKKDFSSIRVFVGTTLCINDNHVGEGGYVKVGAQQMRSRVSSFSPWPKAWAIVVMVPHTYHILMSGFGHLH